MRFIFLILFFNVLVISSCTKKEKTWGPQEMWFHALEQDPSIELVAIPNHEPQRRVLCENYLADGCVAGSGKRVKVRLVELLVIQYKTPKQACMAAKAVGQWYARNWLLDDVTNEPVLESYVTEIFDAKKADNCN